MGATPCGIFFATREATVIAATRAMEQPVHVETKGRREVVGTAASAPAEPAVRNSIPYAVSKRGFDLVAGTVILVMVLPVVPLIAAMIKLDSRGPVFYRQTRVGRGGRKFKFYKFRSMVVGADHKLGELGTTNEQDGPVFKMKRDPRITAVGRFLRRSSLDEIPQVFNVLRGEMSIVGPRPPLPGEVARYQPWQLRRLDVKPGITCLWQISGRSQIGFDEWMRLDAEYLRTRGFWTDLVVFLKTIPAVMGRRGAY
jgi:lipopolysaccharide/colanic/teichoic acid biosynthesis glycosyltransferase